MGWNIEEDLVVVHKPVGWTSFDVVKRVRGLLRAKKVGHAGTLDPLASGVLLLCLGRSTKSISRLQELRKEYRGRFILGQETPSYDTETPVRKTWDLSHATLEDLHNSVVKLRGTLWQTPPDYSAVKVEGQRAYKLARKNQEVQLKPKRVQIFDSEVDTQAWPEIGFRLLCGKGTYVRSWVRDVARGMGVGAVMTELVRTAIGPYALEDALTLEQLAKVRST